MWVNLIISLALSVIGFLLRPKPPASPLSKPGEFKVPRAEKGAEIIRVYGTAWIKAPQVHWWGDQRTKKLKQKSGGKK